MNSSRLWSSHQRHKFFRAEASRNVLEFRVSERQVQNTGHRSQVRSQGTGHRAQGTGYRAQGTGHRAQVTGHRAQGTGHRS